MLHKLNISKSYCKSIILLWKWYVKPYVNNLKNKAIFCELQEFTFFYASI